MGRGWNTRIQLKHLLTDEETPEAINASMKAIAAALRQSLYFRLIDDALLREMDRCTHIAAANGLLNAMYDYADKHRIWIE